MKGLAQATQSNIETGEQNSVRIAETNERLNTKNDQILNLTKQTNEQTQALVEGFASKGTHHVPHPPRHFLSDRGCIRC
jgi:hypothetical protein